LERLSEEEVVKLEIGTGEIFCYHMNEEAKAIQKEIRSANANTGKI
jgi:bisphosphoglycerate-dependent phosphoglycerate mutase